MPLGDSVKGVIDRLNHTVVQFDFELPFSWDLALISRELSAWLTSPEPALPLSVVGLLSGYGVRDIISTTLGHEIGDSIWLFLYSTSILWTRGESDDFKFQRLSKQNLQDVSIFAAHRVLSALDYATTAKTLGKYSKEELTALFIGLLSTIITVSYTIMPVLPVGGTNLPVLYISWVLHVSSLMTSQANSGEPQVHGAAERFLDLKDNLTRILCHFLVYVGQRCGLIDCSISESELIRTGQQLWNKNASYTWLDPEQDTAEFVESSGTPTLDQAAVNFPSGSREVCLLA